MKDFLDVGEKVDLNPDGTLAVGEKEETSAETEAEKKDETKSETEETKKETTDKTDADTSDKTDADEGKTKAKDEEVPAFSFDSFKGYAKEKLEREIETEDDLKSYFDKASKYEGLNKQIEGLQQDKAELTSLASKGLTGRDYFDSDDEYIRQQFLTSNKEKFSEAALSVLSNLSPEKVKKLDPIEAIKVNLMVENSNLEKSEVEALILDEYGLEGEPDEWSNAAKGKMKVAANNAKKSLGNLYKGIEIPEKVDWDAKREEFKGSWEKPLTDIVDGVDKIQLTEDLAFDVTPDMKEGMKDGFMNQLLVSQALPSEEAAASIVGAMRSKILESQFDKVMKVVSDAADERAKEKYRKEIHNDTDINNETRVEGKDDEVLEGKALLNMF